ncbi:hypothetical protein DFJ74DRAFT_709865 [Hyaloraphidium curvatum]|nr:hypothetical protein DFJ74DRAFT_709865 [Hyaloraphidium curvatum]
MAANGCTRAVIPVPRLLALYSIAYAINLPLGYWRTDHPRYSWQWFGLIHASIPLIIPLRKVLLRSFRRPWVVPANIAVAVVGQLVGGRMNEMSRAGKNAAEVREG